MPNFSEMAHWWRVARSFPPWREAFWCGLLHDTVEDGYLTRVLLRWPALNAVTRRDGEVYADFIRRAGGHPVGKAVKLADLRDNLSRGGGAKPSLAKRYRRALATLSPHTPPTL